jgi:GNAT superfamily N-acetyltransferase
LKTEIAITLERDDGDFYVYAHWHDLRVGYLWGTLEGSRLHIDDFKVEDGIPAPKCLVHKVFGFLGLSADVISFRRQGIGSRMLDRLVDEATAVGVAEVWGSVVKNDIEKTGSLLQWYTRRGFALVEPEDLLPDAVHNIVRTLR